MTTIVSDGSSNVSQSSSNITVLNTPPSAFNALMIPSNPVAGVDDPECTAQGADVDGTQLFYHTWELNGNPTSQTSNIIPLPMSPLEIPGHAMPLI